MRTLSTRGSAKVRSTRIHATTAVKPASTLDLSTPCSPHPHFIGGWRRKGAVSPSYMQSHRVGGKPTRLPLCRRGASKSVCPPLPPMLVLVLLQQHPGRRQRRRPPDCRFPPPPSSAAGVWPAASPGQRPRRSASPTPPSGSAQGQNGELCFVLPSPPTPLSTGTLRLLLRSWAPPHLSVHAVTQPAAHGKKNYSLLPGGGT